MACWTRKPTLQHLEEKEMGEIQWKDQYWLDTSILSSLKITDVTNLCLVPLLTDQLAEAVPWNADIVCYL